MKFQDELVKKLFALVKDSEESNENTDKLKVYISKFNSLLLHDPLNLSEIFQLYMLEEPEIDVEYYDDDTLVVKNKFDEVIIRSRSIELQ